MGFPTPGSQNWSPNPMSKRAVSAPLDAHSDDDLRAVLADADLGALVAALVTLTADLRWLDEPYRRACAGLREMVPRSPDPTVRSEVVEAAVTVLRSMRQGTYRAPHRPSDDVLLELMRVVTGADPGPSYLPKLVQDLGLLESPAAPPSGAEGWRGRSVLVIGAGLSGLSMAMRLHEAGIPFQVIEKYDAVGGVWLENNYPECGVDTPNHVYSFGRELKTDWSRHYARRDEILAYINDCATRHRVLDRTRFGTQVQRARYEGETQQWVVDVRSADGRSESLRADVLISAVGSLNRPKLPDIPGLETFAGPAFHTARWPARVDLDGKRIGLVGNGSSGVQVGRSLASRAARLVAFQRSPHWASPNPNTHLAVPPGKQWLLEHLPSYAQWYRFVLYWHHGDGLFGNMTIDPDWAGDGISARSQELRRQLTEHIRTQVGQRADLIEKLVPAYPPYAKRMVVDNDWYATLARPDVELVTEPITGADPAGLITADGRHHDLDVIVFATGFHGTRFLWPMEVRGRSGRTPGEIAGADDDTRAYLGVTMPDFPNFFSIFGPNSSIGHGGSAIFIAECQADYILSCLTAMGDRGLGAVECRTDVRDSYNACLDAGLARLVWSVDGVTSRYRNEAGRIVTNHPWTLQEFWLMTRQADLGDYVLEARASNVAQR